MGDDSGGACCSPLADCRVQSVAVDRLYGSKTEMMSTILRVTSLPGIAKTFRTRLQERVGICRPSKKDAVLAVTMLLLLMTGGRLAVELVLAMLSCNSTSISVAAVSSRQNMLSDLGKIDNANKAQIATVIHTPTQCARSRPDEKAANTFVDSPAQAPRPPQCPKYARSRFRFRTLA